MDDDLSTGPLPPTPTPSNPLRVFAIAAGVVVLVCGSLATVLVITLAPKSSEQPDSGSTMPPEYGLATTRRTTTTTTIRRTTTKLTTTDFSSTVPSSSGPIPDGFEVVTSIHEMSTAIPRNWLSKQMSAGATQATDPQEPTFFVRYGGDTTSDPDVVSSLAAYERDFPARNPGYTKLRLDPGTHHGVTSVDWEFEFDSPEGRKRVGAHYWQLGGVQYFVYASGLTGRWERTQSVLNTMIATAQP